MGECCYAIKQIPDLTLGKYSYLSNNGVDGVLELHRFLLRQLHEKSILTKVSLHLLYYYKHDGAPGNKISIYFFARGKSKYLSNIDKLLKGTALAEYFTFTFLYDRDDDGVTVREAEKERKLVDLLEAKSFRHCNVLTKEEVFFTGRDGATYYNVPPWKPNEDGRLYNMFRAMEALNADFVYRIDIRAEKRNRRLREVLTPGPIAKLHALQSNSGERDYGADSMLRAYDELMKGLDGQPHFGANIFVFSDDSEDGALVMASAASEAIESGDYAIQSYEGNFRCKSFLGRETMQCWSEDDTFVLKVENGKFTTYSERLERAGFEPLNYLSTLYTLDELEPLFRLPALYDGEHIEIPKETAPPASKDNQVLYLGKDAHGYAVNVPLSLLPKHAFVSGVPGSGKTNTMHHLTHSLWHRENPIPFLVLEPAKKEYRALLNLPEMKDVRLFSPCANMSFPLHINPFEFAKGMSVSEHIRTLCAVFEGAFPLENLMPFLLENAIEKVYREKNWRPETIYTDEIKLEFPTMSMLYNELEKELATTTYSGEVKGNLESALKVRIGSLLRREMGDVFDVERSSLTPEEWITIPAIVELESMGKGPANFTTLMLCALIREVLKVNPRFDGPVRHVIFIEEAHNLIGPDAEEKTGSEADAKTAATAFIVNMLAEVRALKEAIFIADQLPTAMADQVIKNTGLKIGLRLTAMDDRQLLCNSMSANSSQIEEMGNFGVGEALISYERLQRPFKMRVNLWCGDKTEEERELLTTSRGDRTLVAALQKNEAFRTNLVRSIRAEFKKLIAQTFQLDEVAQKLLNHMDILRKNKAKIHKLNAQHEELTDKMREILRFRYNDDRNLALRDEEYYEASIDLDILNGEILTCEQAASQAAAVVTPKAVNRLIVDSLELCRIINHKKKKFLMLGVSVTPEDFRQYAIDPQKMEEGTKVLIYAQQVLMRTLLDNAASVYNRGSAYYHLSDKLAGNIEASAKIVGVNLAIKLENKKRSMCT